MTEDPHGIDEGYVKYRSDWRAGPAPDAAAVRLLDTWRRQLHAARLVGHYDDLGIGYGNISIRAARPGEFIITGTQTGHLEETTGAHYALVTRAAIEANLIECTGPVQASSEAMTHAAIYALSERINAVVHVHSRELWERALNGLPTTRPDVPYGTPDMAREFGRLWRESDFQSVGIAAMAGHEEGLVSIGETLPAAALRILKLARGPLPAPA